VFLRRIDGEVDRMALLVSDLLELSRLESGQVTPRLAAVALRPLVDETFDRLRGRAAQLRLRLTNSVPAEAGGLADPDMLRQVFTNLLDNAVKYSTEAGSVTVSCEAVAGNLRIAVADTGQGIPAQHLPHVFERFYKVERARREGGTGLGLAIVKHIIQAHGGEVGVESTEGAGSTFRFTIPAAPAPVGFGEGGAEAPPG
jgi:two-component system phosphate regulon sensor histidine kinase PhoR